jgi:hypothetical protein
MELLQHNVVLQDNRKRNPQSRPVVGDVARLDDGRVVARYRIDFQDGTSATACGDYALDDDPPTLRNVATPTNWTQWMGCEIEKAQGLYRQLGPNDFVPADSIEFASFRKTYPHVAAFVHLPTSAPRSPLFDVGPVQIPWHWHDLDWRQLLHRHDSGDFGIYGKYDDAPLSEEEVFTLSKQPVLTVNKATIAARSGPVRSRYHLSQYRIVSVLTMLSPRGARTLMVADNATADLAGRP